MDAMQATEKVRRMLMVHEMYNNPAAEIQNLLQETNQLIREIEEFKLLDNIFSLYYPACRNWQEWSRLATSFLNATKRIQKVEPCTEIGFLMGFYAHRYLYRVLNKMYVLDGVDCDLGNEWELAYKNANAMNVVFKCYALGSLCEERARDLCAKRHATVREVSTALGFFIRASLRYSIFWRSLQQTSMIECALLPTVGRRLLGMKQDWAILFPDVPEQILPIDELLLCAIKKDL